MSSGRSPLGRPPRSNYRPFYFETNGFGRSTPTMVIFYINARLIDVVPRAELLDVDTSFDIFGASPERHEYLMNRFARKRRRWDA